LANVCHKTLGIFSCADVNFAEFLSGCTIVVTQL